MTDRSRFRHSAATTAILVILLIVAGFIVTCGCTGKSPAQEAVTSAPTTVPAADAGMRIITEEFPPLNYAGPDGTVTGQSTEIVQAILSRLNQEAAIEILPWSEGYAAVQKGPGVALFSTARTEERERLFKWVGPLTMYDFTFYARNDSGITITNVDAVKTAGLIGVVRDDARHQYLVQQNITNIVTCDTDAACLRDVVAGKTKLWFGSEMTAPSIISSEKIDPAAITKVYPVKTLPMYIAFSNDTPDSTIATWQGALDAMKQDGTFASIRQKYGLSPTV